jgi:hypothetical protein
MRRTLGRQQVGQDHILLAKATGVAEKRFKTARLLAAATVPRLLA